MRKSRASAGVLTPNAAENPPRLRQVQVGMSLEAEKKVGVLVSQASHPLIDGIEKSG